MSAPDPKVSDHHDTGTDGDLGTRVVRGGFYLTLRELLGMVVRLGGVTVTTRLIGPGQYGQYYGALSSVLIVAALAQLGADTWIIRMEHDPDDETLAQVWTALLIASVVATGSALLLSLPAAMVVPAREIHIFRWLVLSVPVNVLWAPAQGRLERRLDFRAMARLEIVGDLVLYAVAVPMAATGFGAFSLVAGFAAWQVYLLIASAVLARFRPRLRWSRQASLDLLRFGIGFCSADWTRRLGALSAPVLIGAASGYAGVGYYGLANRLVDTVGFGQRAAGRVGAATFSRIEDPGRMRRALEEGMLIQAGLVGLPMLAMALISRQAIPFIFGARWAPTVSIFCVSCIGALLFSLISLQYYFLYVKGNVYTIAWSNVIRAALLWLICAPFTLAFGVLGYCWAATGASLLGWYVVDRATRRIVPFSYRTTAPWVAALAVAVLVPTVHTPERWLLLLPLALVLADRRSRSGARPSVDRVIRLLRPGRHVAQDGEQPPDGARPRGTEHGTGDREPSIPPPSAGGDDGSSGPPDPAGKREPAASQSERGQVVIMVRDYFPATGGTSTQARLHALGFRGAGYGVVVLTRRLPGQPVKELADGVTVRRVGWGGHTRAGKVVVLLSSWAWLLARRRRVLGVDALMDPDLALAAGAAGLSTRTVLTWATAGDATHFLTGRGKLRRRPLHSILHVVLTPRMSEELAVLGLPASATIPVPADFGRLRRPTPEERVRARAALGLMPEARVVLFVGHLQERKGVHLLLEAIRGLAQTGEDVTLLLVGGPVEPEDHAYAQRLEEQAENAGFGDRVRFYGVRHDVPQFLFAADLFCLPSSREGMPNVLLEAIACGVPCVAPASAGGDALLSDPLDRVPPSNSPGDLRTAILEVLRSPADPRPTSDLTDEQLRSQHDPGRIARHYLELFARTAGPEHTTIHRPET